MLIYEIRTINITSHWNSLKVTALTVSYITNTHPQCCIVFNQARLYRYTTNFLMNHVLVDSNHQHKKLQVWIKFYSRRKQPFLYLDIFFVICVTSTRTRSILQRWRMHCTLLLSNQAFTLKLHPQVDRNCICSLILNQRRCTLV